MNPELRAQLEKLDVWHLTLASNAKKKAPSQKEEDKRLAWEAYYALNKGKSGMGGGEEGDTPLIHVPQCFREIAAANGVYSQQTSANTSKVMKPPPMSADAAVKRVQVEVKRTRTLADVEKESAVHVKEIRDLKENLAEKSRTLDRIEEQMQQALQRESALSSKVDQLSEELEQFYNNRTEWMNEKEELLMQLQESKEENTELTQQKHRLLESEAFLQAEVDRLQQAIQEEKKTMSTAELLPVENSEEIVELKRLLKEASEKSEKACADMEEIRAEKDSVLNKMKHAKQQFDKLRKQSHERNVENESLKAEIERLSQSEQKPVEETNPAATAEDVRKLHALLSEAQSQQSTAEQQAKTLEEELGQLRAVVDEKDAAIEQLMAEIHQTQEEQGSNERKIEEQEAALQSTQRLLEQCQQELELKNNDLDAQITAAEGFRVNMEEMLQIKTGEIEDLSEILDQREQEMEALQHVHQETVALKEELSEKEQELEEGRQQLGLLKDEMATLQTAKVAAEEDVAATSELLSKRETEVLKLKQEFHEFMQQVDSLNEEMAGKDQQLKDMSENIRKQEVDLEEIQNQHHTALQEKDEEMESLASRMQGCLQDMDNLHIRIDAYSTDLTSKEAAIIALNEKSEQDSIVNSRQVQELQEANSDLTVQLESASMEMKNMDKLKAVISELEISNANALTREQTANQKIAELDAALSEALEIAEIADQESRQAVEEKNRMQRDMSAAQEECKQIRSQASVVQDEIRQLKDSVSSKTNEITSVQSQLSRKEVEVESLRTRFQTAETQLREMTSELESVRHELSTTQRGMKEASEKTVEIGSLQERLNAMHASHSEIENGNAQLRTDLHGAQQQISEFQNRLDHAQTEEADLRAQLESSKQYQYQLFEEMETLKASVHAAQQRAEVHEQLSAVQKELQQSVAVNQGLVEEIQQLKLKSEEMTGLQQKIVRLETALAISGQSMQPPPPTASTAELQALQQRASQAEAREADLYAEVESLRIALDEARHPLTTPLVGPSEGTQLVGGMSNKKDEDRGYDVEAAVLSGGDPSGFQPLSGMLRGIPAMKYLSLCIRGADFVDRGFILLMRYPMLRYVLLAYFALLHLLAFV